MDNDEFAPESFDDFNFGKAITQTVALSAASTAGALAGLLVIGFAYEKISDYRTNRAAKKALAK